VWGQIFPVEEHVLLVAGEVKMVATIATICDFEENSFAKKTVIRDIIATFVKVTGK
jgi:hypothetical protein